MQQISGCNGWDCTEQCSGGPWQPSNTPCPSTTNECVHNYLAAGGVLPAPPSPTPLQNSQPMSPLL